MDQITDIHMIPTPTEDLRGRLQYPLAVLIICFWFGLIDWRYSLIVGFTLYVLSLSMIHPSDLDTTIAVPSGKYISIDGIFHTDAPRDIRHHIVAVSEQDSTESQALTPPEPPAPQLQFPEPNGIARNASGPMKQLAIVRYRRSVVSDVQAQPNDAALSLLQLVKVTSSSSYVVPLWAGDSSLLNPVPTSLGMCLDTLSTSSPVIPFSPWATFRSLVFSRIEDVYLPRAALPLFVESPSSEDSTPVVNTGQECLRATACSPDHRPRSSDRLIEWHKAAFSADIESLMHTFNGLTLTERRETTPSTSADVEAIVELFTHLTLVGVEENVPLQNEPDTVEVTVDGPEFVEEDALRAETDAVDEPIIIPICFEDEVTLKTAPVAIAESIGGHYARVGNPEAVEEPIDKYALASTETDTPLQNEPNDISTPTDGQISIGAQNYGPARIEAETIESIEALTEAWVSDNAASEVLSSTKQEITQSTLETKNDGSARIEPETIESIEALTEPWVSHNGKGETVSSTNLGLTDNTFGGRSSNEGTKLDNIAADGVAGADGRMIGLDVQDPATKSSGCGQSMNALPIQQIVDGNAVDAEQAMGGVEVQAEVGDGDDELPDADSAEIQRADDDDKVMIDFDVEADVEMDDGTSGSASDGEAAGGDYMSIQKDSPPEEARNTGTSDSKSHCRRVELNLEKLRGMIRRQRLLRDRIRCGKAEIANRHTFYRGTNGEPMAFNSADTLPQPGQQLGVTFSVSQSEDPTTSTPQYLTSTNHAADLRAARLGKRPETKAVSAEVTGKSPPPGVTVTGRGEAPISTPSTSSPASSPLSASSPKSDQSISTLASTPPSSTSPSSPLPPNVVPANEFSAPRIAKGVIDAPEKQSRKRGCHSYADSNDDACSVNEAEKRNRSQGDHSTPDSSSPEISPTRKVLLARPVKRGPRKSAPQHLDPPSHPHPKLTEESQAETSKKPKQGTASKDEAVPPLSDIPDNRGQLEYMAQVLQVAGDQWDTLGLEDESDDEDGGDEDEQKP